MKLSEYRALSNLEKDTLVAERIMGWKVFRKGIDPPNHGYDYWEEDEFAYGYPPDMDPGDVANVPCSIDDYTGSIRAAWCVVEEMNDCLHLKEHGAEGRWEANFCSCMSHGHGDTAAESICEAALLNLGVVEEDEHD
jgi:hypothetical protein